MTAHPAECVLAVGATLGEGPVWVARESTLWFVDIKDAKVHRFDPATGNHRSWQAPAQIGWVLPTTGGSFLAGLKGGIARFEPDSGSFDPIVRLDGDRPDNRLNDASVDVAGRLWFGSMDDAEEIATGCIRVLERGIVSDVGLPPAVITNGPAVSADGQTLYYTDTLARLIFAVPLHDDGSLGTPRVFASIDSTDGWPDGCTVDAEGGLWTGLWAGWRVRRYAPCGRVTCEVRFPVSNVTKVAFGGSDMRTAYATTAAKGLDAAALAAQPLAGDLFAFDPGVAGINSHEYNSST